MKRRKWKPEQKALIVLEGLKGRPISELCAEHEISQAQYYQWRDLFLANAAKASPLLEPLFGTNFRCRSAGYGNHLRLHGAIP
jgi:transposase-like protein